jgi:hypothetical protein
LRGAGVPVPAVRGGGDGGVPEADQEKSPQPRRAAAVPRRQVLRLARARRHGRHSAQAGATASRLSPSYRIVSYLVNR